MRPLATSDGILIIAAGRSDRSFNFRSQAGALEVLPHFQKVVCATRSKTNENGPGALGRDYFFQRAVNERQHSVRDPKCKFREPLSHHLLILATGHAPLPGLVLRRRKKGAGPDAESALLVQATVSPKCGVVRRATVSQVRLPSPRRSQICPSFDTFLRTNVGPPATTSGIESSAPRFAAPSMCV